MSLKHRYARVRPREGDSPGSKERFFQGRSRASLHGEAGLKCTCWVLVRGGDGPQLQDRDKADCELVPDSSCPVHGKKHYPILEEGY